MHRTNSIQIDGDLQNIYKLGSEIENWPNLLPHYRYVDVLWQHENQMVARMAASRDGLPDPHAPAGDERDLPREAAHFTGFPPFTSTSAPHM